MIEKTSLPIQPGAPFEGGFFAGLIRIGEDTFGLVVAPKAEGETQGIWRSDYDKVPGTDSVFDGLSNTLALDEAGSVLAKWATGLNIEGRTDWYLPSRDELEVVYRALKPSTESNWDAGRHGENMHAVPSTYRYEAATPAQTTAVEFQAGGIQAFDAGSWYWSSTQFSRYFAWAQVFSGGGQRYGGKHDELQARAVRRFKVQ